MKANSIEEFFGTLQQATVETWKEHLKTDKYSAHIALNDFYEDIVELVDTLIEDYQGIYGKIGDYKNLLTSEKLGAIEYLQELRELTKEGRSSLLKEDDPELLSDADAILSLIDSTLYKLKELKEAKEVSLMNYLNESLGKPVNERSIWRTLEDCLIDHITQAVIAAWDETGLEFTHKELKDTLAKVAKEYDVDKHIEWTKEYMK